MPGDKVMLSTRSKSKEKGNKEIERGTNLNTKVATKLKPMYMGPFEVDHMVGNVAVKLKLPMEWKRIHPVFHVEKLRKYHESTSDPLQGLCPPPPSFD